jgi:hypothetical protein
LEVSAFDGDYAHPRKIRYGLDPAGLPYSSFFEVNPDSGVITLRKSLTVSLINYYSNWNDFKFCIFYSIKKPIWSFLQVLDALPTAPITLRVIAEEMDGNVAKDRTNVEVALLIEDVVNRKPKFLKNQ